MRYPKYLALICLLIALPAWAAQYTVSGTWTDPTPAGAGYSPVYDAEWRVNGGAATPINGLSSPAFSTTVTANEGDTIETRVRARNTQGPTGNWTVWFAATAPVVPVTPADQTGVVITIVPQ